MKGLAMPTNPPEKTQILVVDDEDASRYNVTRILRREGYKVTEVATGKDSLREIEKHPDLIILDVHLPDMNGMDISRMVRHDPSTRSIPILQVSATFTGSADKARGLDAGADAYLASPVEPEELLAHVRMLLRLRHAQEALTRTNEHLQSVISNILDVYFSVDLQRRFLEINPAAEKLFGCPAKLLKGKLYVTELPQMVGGILAQAMQTALEERRTVDFEGESRLRPGTWWEGHVHYRDDHLEVYMRDITERMVYEKNLASQNQLLEARVRERTAKLQQTVHDLETFSYSITHDMRAPLRAMQGFSELLKDRYSSKLDPEGIEYLDRIIGAASRLDLLIRDVLSFSNIVRAEVPLAPVDTAKLVQEIIRDYPGLREKGAQFSIQGELPPVLGHEAFLAQCFSNLLDNAVKFVAPGVAPRIEISAEENDGNIRFKIKDNGIGIPPEHGRRIFQLFQRAQSDYPGTGVGLAVVQTAIDRMGGKVGVESAPGKGSIFWIELRKAVTAGTSRQKSQRE